MTEPSIIDHPVGETSASYAVSVAAEVLREHVSAGEIDDIRAQLPDELQPILG